MSLSVLLDGHREMVRLMNSVIEAAGHERCGNEIATARRAMAQAVARHLANKNRLVIAPLLESPVLAHNELARELTDRILTTRQWSIEHYGAWTAAAIEADPREYRMAVRALCRRMEKRFQYEEEEVFPVALEAVAAAARQRAA